MTSGWDATQSTITVGTEAGTVINVAIQFNDATGTAMTSAVLRRDLLQ